METFMVKFMFSKKATKIDEFFTLDLTLCSKRQIDGEDFINICGLLRKYELYPNDHGVYKKRTLFNLRLTSKDAHFDLNYELRGFFSELLILILLSDSELDPFYKQ